jgi:hypothetical protein
MAGRWLDVNSTAEELGISTDAVRKRIARGSLESDRRDGNVLVWLDGGWTEAGHEAQGQASADGGALVEVLTDQVSYLRDQLSEEREARRRADTIIAQLSQTNTQLSNRVLELDAPARSTGASEPSEETSQDAANGPPGPAPRPGGAEAQNGSQRPWWRRVFGGVRGV